MELIEISNIQKKIFKAFKVNVLMIKLRAAIKRLFYTSIIR